MTLPLRYNVRSLIERKTRSALTALGVATAIFISVMMIGLSRGLLSSTRDTASPDNVIVLSKGAESMEFSAIDPADFHLLASSEYIQKDGEQVLASPEEYISTFVGFPDGAVGNERRGVVRGVLPIAAKVHDKLRITAGSGPERGFKVVVGALAATKLGVPAETLTLGQTIEFEGQRWTVAGHFEAPGTTLEAEIWAHLDDVLVATKRTDYSAIAVKTAGAKAMDDFLFDLTMRTDIRVEAKSEAAYYSAIAEHLRPVQVVSVLMTAILVTGAVLAGMNTMFTSILGRTREMGVLLVLGYKRKAVLLSFMFESVLLCLIGGMIGIAAGGLLNGLPIRIPMGAFRFAIDATTLGAGVALAIGIGVVGALLPILRVVRLQTVEALRAT